MEERREFIRLDSVAKPDTAKERRGYVRLDASSEILYVVEGRNERPKMVLLQDISIDGLRLFCHEILKENEILKITLRIPGIEGLFKVKGKVKWQQKIDDDVYNTGIQFVQIEAQDKEKLGNFIKEKVGRIEEDRQNVRCALNAAVKYSLASTPANEQHCFTIDISATGLKLLVKEKMERATKLQLSFNLPEDINRIVAEAEIAWIKPMKDELFEVGVKFLSISEGDQKRLSLYIKKSLGVEK